MSKSTRVLRSPGAHEIRWGETFDFTGYMTWVRTRIECRDVVDPGFTGHKGVPKRFLADAVGGDYTEAGNNYATGPSQNSLPESIT